MPRLKKAPEPEQTPPSKKTRGQPKKADVWKRLPLMTTPEMHEELQSLKAVSGVLMQDLLRIAIQRMIDFCYDEGTIEDFKQRPTEQELQDLQLLASQTLIPIKSLQAIAMERFVKYLKAGGSIDAWRQT